MGPAAKDVEPRALSELPLLLDQATLVTLTSSLARPRTVYVAFLVAMAETAGVVITRDGGLVSAEGGGALGGAGVVGAVEVSAVA